MFFSAVRDGPIYGCVCCQRIKFKKGVVVYDDALKQKMNEKNPNLTNKAVGLPRREFLIDKNFYICEDCRLKLT